MHSPQRGYRVVVQKELASQQNLTYSQPQVDCSEMRKIGGKCLLALVYLYLSECNNGAYEPWRGASQVILSAPDYVYHESFFPLTFAKHITRALSRQFFRKFFFHP